MRIGFRAAVIVASTIVMLAARVPSQAQAPAAGRAQAYRAPRTADGKPNLDGVWQALNEANWGIEGHAAAMGPVAVLGAQFAIPMEYKCPEFAEEVIYGRSRGRSRGVIAPMAVIGAAAQGPRTYDLPLAPEHVHWGYYDARVPPALRIASGDRVRVETMVAGGLQRLRLAGTTEAEIPESMKAVERLVRSFMFSFTFRPTKSKNTMPTIALSPASSAQTVAVKRNTKNEIVTRIQSP